MLLGFQPSYLTLWSPRFSSSQRYSLLIHGGNLLLHPLNTDQQIDMHQAGSNDITNLSRNGLKSIGCSALTPSACRVPI